MAAEAWAAGLILPGFRRSDAPVRHDEFPLAISAESESLVRRGGLFSFPPAQPAPLSRPVFRKAFPPLPLSGQALSDPAICLVPPRWATYRPPVFRPALVSRSS